MTGTNSAESNKTSSNSTNDSNFEQSTTSLRTLDKNAFINPDAKTFDQIVDFLDDKLESGNGETLYQIGDDENGLTEDELTKSIITLEKVVNKLNANYLKLNSSSNVKNHWASFLIRKEAKTDEFQEVRVAVLGNVDSGKSTILSVLTHGQLDDGRGLARQKLFRHKHEVESGRTSSVGNNILGFDSKGNIVNRPVHNNNLNWTEICQQSSKLISFLDLAGHERYLKTTIFGMCGYQPNYCMLIVGANAGSITGMGTTKEHLGLTLAMKMPLFVIVTKIDSTPPNVLSSTLEVLHKILKSSGCRKIPLPIQNDDDVLLAAQNFNSTSKLCPIFQVSSVIGTNLDLLKIFLNLLSPKNEKNLDEEPAEFQIDDTYTVAVGTIVSGIVLRGVIRTNDVLMLGPTNNNKFEPVVIRSIHRKRLPVKEVHSGQSASFNLKKIKRHEVRKGMVICSPSLEPQAYLDFYAEILILHHPTTIQKNYQAMVHVGSVRQTARIINMNKESLRTGDKAKVHLRFIKHPEYIRPNQNLVFREGRTKAIGKILNLISDSSIATPCQTNNKKIKKMISHNKKDDLSNRSNENDLNVKNQL